MKHIAAPVIDYKGLAPLFAVGGGSIIVLLVSLLRSRWVHRVLVPVLTIVALGAAIGLSIWNWEPGDTNFNDIVSGSLDATIMARATGAKALPGKFFLAAIYARLGG